MKILLYKFFKHIFIKDTMKKSLLSCVLIIFANAKCADQASIEQKNKTPLRDVLRKDQSAFQYLLEAGQDPNEKDADGKPVLHDIPIYGTAKDITALAKAGANLNAPDQYGNTLLHNVVHYLYKDYQECFRALIAAGADANARDKHGNTPLHEAKGYYVNSLLDAGADPDAKNRFNQTPLYKLADHYNGKLEIGNIKRRTLDNLLDRRGVVDLIKAGAYPNDKDTVWGKTALHCAAEKGKAGVALALLNAGACKSLRNEQGKTAFNLAIENKRFLTALVIALAGNFKGNHFNIGV